MGWIVLILGVALWWAAHLFKRVAPERRAAMGDPGKGLVALLLVGSIVLMVLGYRATPYVELWAYQPFFVHINNLLMLVAIFLFSPAPKRGKLTAGLRHPQLTAFKTWAVAHLLVNGDVASVVLFGGLLAWAVMSVIVINRSAPDWTRRDGGSLAMDGVFLAGSAVLLVVIGYIHSWLGPWPFPG
jgi:uncharacterized membrane protein